MWHRSLRYNIIVFLRLKSTPAKMALGFALGACVNFYPTFGLGILIAGFFAIITFSNVPSGIIGDIVFKPLFPLFFYFNFLSGDWILGERTKNVKVIIQEILHLKWDTLAYVGKTFFVGALINTLILGSFLFVAVYIIIKGFRKKLLKLLCSKKPSRGKMPCASKDI